MTLSKFLKVLPVAVSLLSLSVAHAAAEGPGPFPFFAKKRGLQHFDGAGPGSFGPGAFRDGPGRRGGDRFDGPPFADVGPGEGGPLPALILGAVVGGAVSEARRPRVYEAEDAYAEYDGPQPWSKGWFRYCSARYQTFDPDSGTYVSRSGKRRFCQAD